MVIFRGWNVPKFCLHAWRNVTATTPCLSALRNFWMAPMLLCHYSKYSKYIPIKCPSFWESMGGYIIYSGVPNRSGGINRGKKSPLFPIGSIFGPKTAAKRHFLAVLLPRKTKFSRVEINTRFKNDYENVNWPVGLYRLYRLACTLDFFSFLCDKNSSQAVWHDDSNVYHISNGMIIVRKTAINPHFGPLPLNCIDGKVSETYMVSYAIVSTFWHYFSLQMTFFKY